MNRIAAWRPATPRTAFSRTAVVRTAVPLIVLALVAALAAGCVATAGPYHHARRPVEVEVDVVFYEVLAPYGEWIWMAEWGWVWSPRSVGRDWRPYTVGQWVSTRDGWTWVSHWEWGWAPFHYGRWTWDRRLGWVWLPGSVWAPAWVAWRVGDGWIGWAPLPPEASWRIGFGFEPWPVAIDPFWWSFVRHDRFAEPRLRQVVIPGEREPALLRDTRDVTRYEGDGRRVVERGLPADPGGGARAVPRAPIEDVDRPGEATRRPVDDGERVRVYRPEVQRAPDRPAAGARRTRPPRKPGG
ncbi:MAG TPA: DUF6600 domain-containing protein [Thermoanaerobaculia bacterium]